MNTIYEIKQKIVELLRLDGATQYFSVYSTHGKKIKIRVGDHSANKQNNNCKTLSFITQRTSQRISGYNQMANEWVIDMESEMTDTFQSIEEVLEWEEVSDNQEEAEFLNY